MRTIALRLRPGADLKAELLALAAREGVRAGWVLTCVGSLSPVSTPAALVVRVAGSVRVALELDGGVAIVTRSAPG
jgi:hypothetical protein